MYFCTTPGDKCFSMVQKALVTNQLAYSFNQLSYRHTSCHTATHLEGRHIYSPRSTCPDQPGGQEVIDGGATDNSDGIAQLVECRTRDRKVAS